jgi:glycosyltransferase involved in cell wall biosynthesis
MVGRALESATCHGCEGVEVIVLDGGSTDGTVEVIRRYEDKISHWRSAPDGGPTNAINEGIRSAKGDVISLLPGDDWLEPGALAAVLDEFAADSDLDVLSCGVRYVRVDSHGEMHVEKTFATSNALDFNLQNILRTPLTAARFIRRRVYLRLGGHSVEYRFGDFDFLVRVCLSGVKSRVLPRLTYNYRAHPQSSTLGRNANMELAMLSEGVKMADHYLACGNLTTADRNHFVRLHGRFSAHWAWKTVRRQEFKLTGGIILAAVRMNPLWPLHLVGWCVQYLKQRGVRG